VTRWAQLLLGGSAVVAAVTGLAYVVAPSAALSIVGVGADGTNEFLLRTEGIALLASGGYLAVLAARPAPLTWLALLVAAGYYVLGSLVDLQAFANGIVGPASVPSAAVRIGVGAVCVVVAARLLRNHEDPSAP